MGFGFVNAWGLVLDSGFVNWMPIPARDSRRVPN